MRIGLAVHEPDLLTVRHENERNKEDATYLHQHASRTCRGLRSGDAKGSTTRRPSSKLPVLQVLRQENSAFGRLRGGDDERVPPGEAKAFLEDLHSPEDGRIDLDGFPD